MWNKSEMNETQKNLLKRNIIDLGGEVDDDMAMYVRESLIHFISLGSHKIEVIITSDGGKVNIGLDIYDMLRLYKGKKIGKVMGYARSMAVVILQACNFRCCSRHGEIMIHHISREMISLDILRDQRKLKKEKADMEESQNRIYKILSEKTGHSTKKIREVCKEERNMTSEAALKFNLIDQII